MQGEPLFDAYVFLAMTEPRPGNMGAAYAAFDRAYRLADEDDEGHMRLLAEAEELVSGDVKDANLAGLVASGQKSTTT